MHAAWCKPQDTCQALASSGEPTLSLDAEDREDREGSSKAIGCGTNEAEDGGIPHCP